MQPGAQIRGRTLDVPLMLNAGARGVGRIGSCRPMASADPEPPRRSERQMVAAIAQRGVALILVLWVMALMAILLGSFALMARTENLEARHMFDGTTARYGAEAGLERAVYELRNPDLTTRWVCDGRPYEFDFENAHIHIEILDESGKIDLNSADDTICCNRCSFPSAWIRIRRPRCRPRSRTGAIGDDIPHAERRRRVDAVQSGRDCRTVRATRRSRPIRKCSR